MRTDPAYLAWARGHTRVAAYTLCVDVQRRILLCRLSPGESAAGQWTLPGGGINFGERPVDAALRELSEETGLVGQVDELAFIESWSRPPRFDRDEDAWHAVQIVFQATITGGELHDEADESTDHAEWVPLATVTNLALVDLVEKALHWLLDPSVALK